MLKTLLFVSTFLAAPPLWSQTVDSGSLTPVGVTSNQTLRLNVSASSSRSCAAQLGFLDSEGNAIDPSSGISLKAGEFTFLELPPSAVAAKPGQRVDVRPRFELAPSTIPSACQTSVSVLGTQAEPSPQEAREAKPAGGTQEGIKVHGHWTIEVRDPDGTVAAHREFENALLNQGGQILPTILLGANIVGSWFVTLDGNSAALSPFVPSLGSGGNGFTSPPFSLTTCNLFQPSDFFGGPAPSTFGTLTLSLPTGLYNQVTNPYTYDLVLSGSFTAQRTGTISQVSTVVETCPIALGSCNYNNSSPFSNLKSMTGTVLSNAVAVAQGQFVTVTAAIVFS